MTGLEPDMLPDWHQPYLDGGEGVPVGSPQSNVSDEDDPAAVESQERLLLGHSIVEKVSLTPGQIEKIFLSFIAAVTLIFNFTHAFTKQLDDWNIKRLPEASRTVLKACEKANHILNNKNVTRKELGALSLDPNQAPREIEELFNRPEMWSDQSNVEALINSTNSPLFLMRKAIEVRSRGKMTPENFESYLTAIANHIKGLRGLNDNPKQIYKFLACASQYKFLNPLLKEAFKSVFSQINKLNGLQIEEVRKYAVTAGDVQVLTAYSNLLNTQKSDDLEAALEAEAQQKGT